jgi:hypothetical protein
MTTHRTIRLIAAGCAVLVLALAGLSPGAAKPPIPELGNADPPAMESARAPRARALFVLQRAGSGPCGTETYVIEVGGRRIAELC